MKDKEVQNRELFSMETEIGKLRQQICGLTGPHCTALHCTGPGLGVWEPPSSALHCTADCTALHCTALHSPGTRVSSHRSSTTTGQASCTTRPTLHCTALHCTALHCTALHCRQAALPDRCLRAAFRGGARVLGPRL
jgi:hypothetical protein